MNQRLREVKPAISGNSRLRSVDNMAGTQIDQFTQALFGRVESVLILCAILILVVGIPLYWLRLKAERTLIRVIRSARDRRQVHKSTPISTASETVPHCPVCNALMVKRLARRGASAGNERVSIKRYKNVSIMNNRHDDIASALPADLDALLRQGES